MRAGLLKHRVEYQTLDKIKDDVGGYTTTWIIFAKAWCRMVTGSVTAGAAHEAVNAKKEQAVKSFVLRHRIIKGLTEQMRVKEGCRILKITGILYPNNDKDYMEVIAEELGLNES